MNDAIPSATARAVLGRFTAALFSEPDATWKARFLDTGIADELRESFESLNLPESLLRRVLDSLDDVAVLQRERIALMGHTVRSSCPPYELEYQRGEVFYQAQLLADIAAFYRAFGLEGAGPLIERPDHFVAEWEFLSIAAAKEAQALNERNDAAALACTDAQESFLRDHAAAWMPAFLHRIRRASGNGFYGRAAALAEALLKHWRSHFQVALGPDWLELRPAEEADFDMTCGGGAGGTVELGARLAAGLNRSSTDASGH